MTEPLTKDHHAACASVVTRGLAACNCQKITQEAYDRCVPPREQPASNELVSMARAAQRDERLSDGALYGKLADEIERLDADAACEKAEKESLKLEVERLQRRYDEINRDWLDLLAHTDVENRRLRAALEQIASGDIIQGMSHELFATKVLDGMPPDETTAKLTCGCVTKCDPASLQAGEVCVNSLL